jgi:hypothetical protein
MRRPGYLGSLNDFWGVRRNHKRQPRLRQVRSLGYYLGDGAAKMVAEAAEMAVKAQEQAQKQAQEQMREQQEKMLKQQEKMLKQQHEAEELQMKEQKVQLKEMKGEPVTTVQPAPSVSIITPALTPASSALAPALVPGPALTPAATAAIITAPISTAAFATKMAPYMPGYTTPMMASRPGMSQGLPVQRAQALPGRASPARAPIITPQMARLGKIAAAIGAGMFLL